MAKGNFVLGTTSGSIGDLTTYAREGDQITRRRARVVKNPRTAAQTMNRVIAATIGSAYSHMNAIVDHSFQGYSTKAANMRRFLKVNQQAVRKMLANTPFPLNAGSFQAIGQKGLVRFPFLISEGSMPSLAVKLSSTAGESQKPTLVLGHSGEQAPTYQEVCDLLGLQRGDQITLCFIQGYASATIGDPDEFWGETVTFKYARIILDPVDDPSEIAPMTEKFITVNGNINDPNPLNETDCIASIAISDGNLEITLKASGVLGTGCIAFAAISSRKENSVWLRSNAALKVKSEYADTPTLADAINASYPDMTGITDPTKFLNAAQALKV